ncbi:RES family NAD+ phosphorylase [Pseudarthrobacter sp. L19]|uniref:RES family NAD+ phosphorylase n=1 Tax=Pseudarthrobacter sp. L19 TaxID=3423951 RepID=UPI003D7AD483
MRTVTGTFFRAVDPAYQDAALAGPRSAGRYSPPDVPTLYLSSSRDGGAAAMIAHSNERTPELDVLQFDVEARRIIDLRDHNALKSIGIDRDRSCRRSGRLAERTCRRRNPSFVESPRNP